MNYCLRKLSIIIPAYNEGKTIHQILNKLKKISLINGVEKEIIIVNDYSTDNTEAVSYTHLDVYKRQDISFFLYLLNLKIIFFQLEI